MGGYVYIVGAGPGDPSLLTLRGREALERAQVVIYDNLIDPAVLEWAPDAAEKIWMGKVGHRHHLGQEEISAALVAKAREGRVVVRLKGGDPAIFGRLGEEGQALADAGIPFEVVPGVTSASGASAYAGIPLTYRDCAPSVSFVTGHRRRDGGARPAIDWEALARASGTLVFYMAVRNLEEITRRLAAAGRTPETPAALVRRATWPDQEVLEGTLGDLPERARAAPSEAPALLVVGDVVRLRPQLAWFERRALRGRRVLVTRAVHQAENLSRLLKSRGAVPVGLPLIELRAWGHKSAVDASLRRLFAYDWVVFSSANAVDFTFSRLSGMGLDARAFGAARVCAVGPKTAYALERRGIRPDVVPEEYVAEALVEALSREEGLSGASVLIPRAKEAREVIPDELERRGARVDVLPVYENVRPEAYPPEALGALERGELDAVMLASSSAARNYHALCLERGWDPGRIPCAVIGPATRKTAESLALPVAAAAAEYTIEGLVGALEAYFRARPPVRPATAGGGPAAMGGDR